MFCQNGRGYKNFDVDCLSYDENTTLGLSGREDSELVDETETSLSIYQDI